MRKSLLYIAAATVMVVGCSKAVISEGTDYDGPVTRVSATFEGLQETQTTKASVTEEGVFAWQNGDVASFTVTDGGNTVYAAGTNSKDGAKADFTILGTLSSSPWAVYPSDLTQDQSTGSLTVNVPACRAWEANQTNVAMYASYTAPNFNFCHLGGLVRVRVVNVPANATKFVFKTPGKKINGVFTVSGNPKTIDTSDSSTEEEQSYTLTFSSVVANTTMDFYVPLPVGTYAGGFSFYLKDSEDEVLSKVEGTTSQTIARKSLLLMPAITLAEGTIEEGEQTATSQTIPAGYQGDFLLAQSDNVILTIEASSGKNVNLKYNSGTQPSNLEIKVKDGDEAGVFEGTVSGDLPSTHVEFTYGTIQTASLTTSATTLEVINPAKVSGKVIVNGGNIVVKGATVKRIEIAGTAVADPVTQSPVRVVIEKEGETEPCVTDGISANANVIVVPEESVTVKVTSASDVKVANEGEGTVIGATLSNIEAKIGQQNYFTLADAIAAVKDGEVITMQEDVAKAAGISVPSGKNFTVDFNGMTYSAECPGAGSAKTKTLAFQLLENSTILFKNGTINCTEANKSKTWDSSSESKGIAMIIQNYADLTLEDMVIDAANIAHNGSSARYAVSNNCGTVEFKGATTISAPVAGDYAFDVCKYGSYAAPKVTWNSTGEVDGLVELSGGEFVVAEDLALSKPVKVVGTATMTVNADVTPDSEWNGGDGLVVVNRKGNLTLKGTGKISNDGNESVYEAVKLTEKGENDATYAATLTVDGPTLEGYYYGITGNGGRQNTVTTIVSGSVKGCAQNDCAGIYHPQSGTLTINGGTVEGAVGIYVKAGTVVTSVAGGTVKGTGIKKAYQTQLSGFVATGDAIVFDNCDYPGGEPNATISGGSFISTNGLAVASYAKTGKTPIAPVITGGTFSDENVVNYAATNAVFTVKLQSDRTDGTGVFVSADKSQNITFDLNGYTFSAKGPAVGSTGTKTQAFHLEKGNNVTIKNGTLNVAADAENVKMLIQNYANLTLENVQIDGSNLIEHPTIKYVISNNAASCVFSGTTSITGKAGFFAFDVDKGSDVTWNASGAVDGAIELTKGTLTVSHDLGVNAPILAAGKASLIVNADITPSSSLESFAGTKDAILVVRRGADLTLSGTGKIDSKTVASAIKMTTSGDSGDSCAKLTVNSGTYVGDYYAISGNGNRNNTEIVINGGTFKGNHANDNLAIFHPQDGSLSISNGVFEGYSSAVEMRSGTLNITGGSFISNASSYSCTANSNGNTTVGAALAIAQHNTGNGISASVTGATFSGVYKLSMKDPQGKGWSNVSVNWFDTHYSSETLID